MTPVERLARTIATEAHAGQVDHVLPTTREELAEFFGGIRLPGSGAVVTGCFVQYALDLLDEHRVSTAQEPTEHVDLIDGDGDRWSQVEPGRDAWWCHSPGYVGDCSETRAYVERKHGPVTTESPTPPGSPSSTTPPGNG